MPSGKKITLLICSQFFFFFYVCILIFKNTDTIKIFFLNYKIKVKTLICDMMECELPGGHLIVKKHFFFKFCVMT